ncbi:MAG: sodium:proton antiporter [Pseudomonadales bacterium]|nr:sodium:proton antiporter [Pseudomonadales bacterium]
MSVYYTLCFFSTVAIFIAFINHKFFHLQPTIAITAGSLLLSLVILVLGHTQWLELRSFATTVIEHIHFETFLLHGVLSFLLFAGGLGIKLPHLKDQKWEVTVLAIVATCISTAVIGFGLYYLCQLIAVPLPLIYCLLFGALISPTDPISVMAIVKKLGAPQRIAIQIEGESLFNDGFGLVIFVTIFSIAFGSDTPTVSETVLLFFRETMGGVAFGLLLGVVFHHLIRAIDNHTLQLLMTLTIPTSGYAIADMLGVSGPLAMVVSGIIIGNWTRESGFSDQGEGYLDEFWLMVDELINSLLYLLIGLVMLTFSFHKEDWMLMGLSIPLVLLGRYISVSMTYFGFRRFRTYNPMSVPILTWGGLRGGLAIALAMMIPPGVMVMPEQGMDVREIILVMTFSVVVFSILIQGLTISPLIIKAQRLDKE